MITRFTSKNFPAAKNINISGSWVFLLTTHGLIWSEVSLFNAQGSAIVKRISEGNYSPKSLGQDLQDAFKSKGVKVEMNTPQGVRKSTVLK